MGVRWVVRCKVGGQHNQRRLPDNFNSVTFNDWHGYNLIWEVFHYQAASCSLCSLNLQYVDMSTALTIIRSPKISRDFGFYGFAVEQNGFT